ncbi:MAG TPA: hypothetical protein VM165_05060, partial [Planctomycetaceae bacterium]|nr:hypothetical protein [Planctomycetaceae bacterium]
AAQHVSEPLPVVRIVVDGEQPRSLNHRSLPRNVRAVFLQTEIPSRVLKYGSPFMRSVSFAFPERSQRGNSVGSALL